MTSCLKKGATVKHNPEFVQCFETCKELLTNEPILAYPDFSKPFNLTTDASQVAIGAVLSQGRIGLDKPIAFASRTLNNAEQNYSVIERELLAIIWATKYFRPYLYGRKFSIYTDHRPLNWLFSIKEPNSKLLRWRLKLEEFDFDINYKKGSMNSNADALSRIQISEINNNNTTHVEKPNNEDNSSTVGNINENPDVADFEEDENDTVHTSVENPIFEIPISDTPINYFKNQIFIKCVKHHPKVPKIIRLFTNKIRTIIEISEINFEEDIINIFKEFSTTNKLFAVHLEKAELIPRFCRTLQNIFKTPSFKLLLCNQFLEDVKTPERQEEIIKLHHEGRTNHRGITEIECEIKRQYYWPNIRNSVTNYINNCSLCQRMKYDRHLPQQKYSLTPTPKKPFEIVHIDTFTIKKQKFLTLVDKFSKYGQAYPLDSLTAIHVAKTFMNFITHHGIPKLLILDNGSELKNKIISDLSSLHKIGLHYTTPLNPNSNSTVERFHSTIIEHLRILIERKKDLNIIDLMPYAVLGYNHSIHSTTKQRPIDVINGHLDVNNVFDLDINKILYSNYVNQHKEKTLEMYKHLNQQMSKNKETILEKRNESRHDPLAYEPNTIGYHKTRARDKTSPQFRAHIVNSDNMDKINTPENIYHKSNFKRPLTNQKTVSLQDPSCHRSNGNRSRNNNHKS